MLRASQILMFVFCMSLPAWAQWVIGAYVGAAHTQDSGVLVDQPPLHSRLRFSPVAYEGQSFRSPFYYGGHGDYFFTPHWGIGAEFIHLKVFAKTALPVSVAGMLNGQPISRQEPMSAVVQRFSISHGVNLLFGQALFRQQLWHGSEERLPRLLMNLRVGFGITVPHPESEIQGRVDEHYQMGSAALQAAAGLELQLWHKLYWQGEYKYTHTRQHVDVFAGRAQTLLDSHHLVTGPVIHF